MLDLSKISDTDSELLVLSKSKDDTLLNRLVYLLNRHTYYKALRYFPQRTTKTFLSIHSPISFQRYLSPCATFSMLSSRRSAIEINSIRDFSLKLTPKSKTSAFSIEQSSTIQNIFSKIENSYSKTDWVKSSPEPEVHKTMIKQF
jgi:hypothetical protein